jgi:hypothetical protein
MTFGRFHFNGWLGLYLIHPDCSVVLDLISQKMAIMTHIEAIIIRASIFSWTTLIVTHKTATINDISPKKKACFLEILEFGKRILLMNL